MIKLLNINLEYASTAGKTKALENINFEIYHEEFVSIIGPSGCGKSSLLHLIGGFIKPTSGNIYVDNTILEVPNTDIGIVFQKFSLFPWQTISENIEFGLKQKNISSDLRKEIVTAYLKDIGLFEFKNSYPSSLSIGMQQRVALARAYANDPKILLMDEPFASLDIQTKLKMRNMLLNIWNKKKKTIVFVTHDIEEAIMLSDRIIILTSRPGKVQTQLLINVSRPRGLEILYSSDFIYLKQKIYEMIYED